MKAEGLLFSKHLAVAIVCCFALTSSRASIVGPYTVDSSTLHLWHLDESAIPAVDSTAGGTGLIGLINGATLGNASYSGFGTALNTGEVGAGNITATKRDAILTAQGLGTNVTIAYMDPITSAFTYEAMVRIDFDPAQNL